jgi:hypothetical protein
MASPFPVFGAARDAPFAICCAFVPSPARRCSGLRSPPHVAPFWPGRSFRLTDPPTSLRPPPPSRPPLLPCLRHSLLSDSDRPKKTGKHTWTIFSPRDALMLGHALVTFETATDSDCIRHCLLVVSVEAHPSTPPLSALLAYAFGSIKPTQHQTSAHDKTPSPSDTYPAWFARA